jgi:hypothetical protein
VSQNVSINQKEYRYSPKQDKTYLLKEEEMMKTHIKTNEINRIEKRAIEASVVASIKEA